MGIEPGSLREGIDGTTSGGELVFRVSGRLARGRLMRKGAAVGIEVAGLPPIPAG